MPRLRLSVALLAVTAATLGAQEKKADKLLLAQNSVGPLILHSKAVSTPTWHERPISWSAR